MFDVPFQRIKLAARYPEVAHILALDILHLYPRLAPFRNRLSNEPESRILDPFICTGIAILASLFGLNFQTSAITMKAFVYQLIQGWAIGPPSGNTITSEMKFAFMDTFRCRCKHTEEDSADFEVKLTLVAFEAGIVQAHPGVKRNISWRLY